MMKYLNSEAEYVEILILPTRTGGLGQRKKDYGYACKILKVESCELKSVQVSPHSVSESLCLRCKRVLYRFLHDSPELAVPQQVRVHVPLFSTQQLCFWAGCVAIFSMVCIAMQLCNVCVYKWLLKVPADPQAILTFHCIVAQCYATVQWLCK